MTLQQSGVRPDYQSGNFLGFQGNIKRFESNCKLSVATLLHVQFSSMLFAVHYCVDFIEVGILRV